MTAETPVGRRLPPLVAALVAVLLTALDLGAAPAGAVQDDPSLEQRVDADEPVATGTAELATGHVDMGPRPVEGRWTLLIRDDGPVPPVWRRPDETVLRVGDAALLPVPDDPAYAFLDVPAGREVHVVPQTQDPDVVWLGWNTQAPQAIELMDRGTTLTLLGVDGPGELTVFLQSGTLGAPQVLWRSADAAPQSFWVDVNTHTHANWVFTEPGAYLVQVEARAETAAGEELRDVGLLRFAVGDDVATAEVMAAQPSAPATDAAAPAGDDGVLGEADDAGDADSAPLVLGGGAVLLAAAVALVAVRGARAKRRAEVGAGAGAERRLGPSER